MTVCKTKGHEKGAWFEIKCIKDIIISKESKGQDASYERGLLKAWAKVDGYKTASNALSECDKSKSRG